MDLVTAELANMNAILALHRSTDEQRAIEALIEHLLASNAVTRPALDRARRAAGASKERIDKVLYKLGLVEERALAGAWASVLGIPIIGPAEFPGQSILADRLPARFLRNSSVLPVKLNDSNLCVAVTDPLNSYVTSAIAVRTGLQVDRVIATRSDLTAAFARLFPDVDPETLDDTDTGNAELAASDLTRLQDLATDAPAIRLVESIIERAVELKASDIHFTNSRNGPRLRFRTDGVLNDIDPPPPDLYSAVISRLKILSDLDIAERRLPQDGRIRLGVSGREIDLRVATMPHLDSEGVVLRILDRTVVKLDLPSLGFAGDIESTLLQLLTEPHGILLVTGPTGSGKTTTLYAALRKLVQPERNIVSVEDPVEYQLEGVSQIQVQRKIGLDFPTVLRAVLRQDPDVIMVGEIRDPETATIANQAALTGHFVLATLHTNSAAAALPRLIDMGVEPYLLSTTVRGVLSQRLVRKFCPSCARPIRRDQIPTPEHLQSLCTIPISDWNVHAAVGCVGCNNTGYAGRIAIAELLVVDDEIRAAILDRADEMRLEKIARRKGVVPLIQDGAARVAAGETTLGEVFRVAGGGVE
jgi:general secretion pathway protein E